MLGDNSFAFFLYTLTSKSEPLTWLMIFLGSWLIFVLGAFFTWQLFKEKQWQKRFYLFATATISLILSRAIITEIITYFYYRPRPFEVFGVAPLIEHAPSASFPSGHITFIMPIALSFFLISKRAGFLALFGVLLIGLGRVALGVHWPSDIAGGMAVGLLSFLVIYYSLRLKKNHSHVPAGNQS